MWLNIRVGCAEKLFYPLNGQRFDFIDIFAAAIIAFARITFGIFIRQDRSLRPHDVLGNDIFRCNQFDLVLLATQFAFDGFRNGTIFHACMGRALRHIDISENSMVRSDFS